VSHNMAAVSKLTHKAVYLKEGKVVKISTTNEVINFYISDSMGINQDIKDIKYYNRNFRQDAPCHFEKIIVNNNLSQVPIIQMGEGLQIEIKILSEKPLTGILCTISLYDEQGRQVVTLSSTDVEKVFDLRKGMNSIMFNVDPLPVPSGKFFAHIGINTNDSTQALDALLDYPIVEVRMKDTLIWKNRIWGASHWYTVKWGQLYAE